MSIVLFINLKGGVAKTTNAVAVAECLAVTGHNTLVIDADHQCTASEMLLGEDRLLRLDKRRATLHDLLAAMLDDDFTTGQFDFHISSNGASNIGEGLENLHVLPCSVRIDDFATNMARAKRGYRSNEEFLQVFDRRKKQFKRFLESRYDFVIADCPPSVALQVKALLGMADGYIIPSVPDRLSVRGSLYLLDRIRRGGYTKIRPLGTLWSLYRQQNHVHREVVRRAAGGEDPFDKLPAPFETIIPNATAIADAAEEGNKPKSFRAKYSSQFAALYEKLCLEIVQRSQWGPATPEAVPQPTAART